jgi:hypothetical protein
MEIGFSGRTFARAGAALLLAAAPLAAQQSTLTTTYLVVTDRTSNNILRYETTGDFKDAFVQSPIFSPESVIFGFDQNLYISSFSTGSIERYNGATGNYVGRFVGGSGSNLRNPEGIKFGPDGNLYVVDRTQSAVLRYDGGTGAFIDQFVKAGAGGYNNAGGIVFGPDGNLYATSGTQSQTGPGSTSPQILRFDGSTGAFKDVFVPVGSGGISSPFSLLFGPDGNLYVSNVTSNSILRYDGRTGAFLGAFVPSNSGGLSRPTGMAFGPDGFFYVASSFLPTVAILRYNATSGAFVDTFIPAGRGGLAGPTDILFYTFESQIAPVGRDPAVATDPGGNRMIVWTDDNVVKIQPFDASGKATALPRTVSPAGEIASHPRITALGPSLFLLSWEAKPPTSGPGQIRTLPVPGTGAPSLSPPPISQPPPAFNDGFAQVATLSGSRGAIVWSRSDSTGRSVGIIGRVVDSTGTPIGGEVTLSSTTVSSDEAPTIATDGNDRAVVAWKRRRIDGTSTTIIAGSTDSALRPTAAAVIIDDGTAGAVGNPAIAANSGGRAMLAWSRAAGSVSRILLQPLTMTVAPSGSLTTVNADLGRNASLPQVSINQPGTVGLVWQYKGLLGGTGIYGRSLDPSGAIDKADFVVSDAVNSSETFNVPAISVTPSNNVTIASEKSTTGIPSGVYTRTQNPPPRPPQSTSCTQNATTLCLSGDRFAVSATWRTNDGSSGNGQAVRLTTDTGYFTFFDPNNVEVVVKVLSACGLNSRFWVFAGGLTNVNVVLTVRDSVTGTTKTYTNPANTAFQPIQDTDAFPTCSASLPVETESFASRFAATSWRESQPALASIAPNASCTANATTICLNNDRFAVSATWRANDGSSGVGQAVRLTADTGYFTFFSATNVEVVIKVLNACGLNSKYWVFAGGLTNVNVVLTVRDTVSGTVRTFTNPINTAFQPIQDTGAFATCP